MPRLGAVVEGQGDREALKILIERLLAEEYRRHDWQVLNPKSAGGRGALTIPGGLERAIKQAFDDERTPPDAMLVLLDGDAVDYLDPNQRPRNTSSAEFAKLLARRVRAIDPHIPVPVGIGIAHRMYEAWLVASIETTAAQLPGQPSGLRCPPNVEELRDPKQWLSEQVRRVLPRKKYEPVRNQAPMTRTLDFALVARRCNSFREFQSTLKQLLDAVAQNDPRVIP